MGNWTMPLVRKDGAPVGYMSDNGRLWNQEFMDTDDDAQKKKYGQYWPKQLEVTGDDPEPMVLVTSKLLDEYRINEEAYEIEEWHRETD